MVRSEVPLPKSCVIRAGRLSINNIEGCGADLASCHRGAAVGGALFRDGEVCSPRRYELVSDDDSVSVCKSDSSSFLTASMARCLSNPFVGGAKIGA